MKTQRKEDKPSKKEVLKEIASPIFNKKTKNYLKDSLIDNTAIYTIPTSLRKFNKNLTKITYTKDFTFLGKIGLISQASVYFILSQKGIPAYLLPIATNVLSGVYETGRYVYNKAEQRLIDKNKNLENKFEEKIK